MPKVVVLYASETGLTERLAKTIAKGIKDVRNVEVELLKVGTAFSLSKFDEVDAIILGSPTHYGDITPEMKLLLESAKALKEGRQLNLSKKIGAVFCSFVWDGGWITYKLEALMKALGVRIVASAVSVRDLMGMDGIRVEEETLQRCRNLGRAVALECLVDE